MPDDRDKPQPGAVPHFVSPHQVTAPLPLHQGPWIYPPPPVLEPKKEESHAGIKLAIQIIMAALALGGVIFAAGVAREKLNNIETNQKAESGVRAEHKRQQEERDEKVAKAIEGLRGDVGAVKEDVASLKAAVRRRRVARSDSSP